MNCARKLKMLKVMLGVDPADNSLDDKLQAYLELSRDEIINWMWINHKDRPSEVELPDKYSTVQVQAVVTGFNMQGGENQFRHTENGITREWHYSDMVDYIRAHVNQIPVIPRGV